ncbi:MAG TPA: hypothetical protein VFX50_10510 [Gemmatimonadales bacterium]|nr:hypothetical protein [Gemmatimonadales bacterium]
MRKLAVGLAAGAAPALALACATCARDQGSGALLLVGAMIVAPYLVAAVVIRAIRAAGAEP